MKPVDVGIPVPLAEEVEFAGKGGALELGIPDVNELLDCGEVLSGTGIDVVGVIPVDNKIDEEE